MQSKTKEKLIFVGPAIIYLLAFSVFPLIYSLRISLTNLNIARPATGKFIGLKNYLELFSFDSLFIKVVINTSLIIVVALIIELVLGYMIAHIFFSARILKGTSVLRTIYMIPIMVTPLIFGLMWKYILNPTLGIMNYLLSFIKIKPIPWFGSSKTALLSIIGVDIWQWTPFVTMVLLAGLLTIPQEIFEAAEIDGAKWYQKIKFIEIPIINKIIGIALIMRLMDLFRMFDLVYAATEGGPGGSTDVISMFAYRESFNYYNTGMGSAASIIALIITIFISTLLVRYFRGRE